MAEIIPFKGARERLIRQKIERHRAHHLEAVRRGNVPRDNSRDFLLKLMELEEELKEEIRRSGWGTPC